MKQELTEQEIKNVCRYLNGGGDCSILDELDEPWDLTNEQYRKAKTMLLDQWKTPKGIVRKNNPFVQRETDILDFSESITIRVIGFVNNHPYTKFYTPIYNVSCGSNSFDYYMSGGIQICR